MAIIRKALDRTVQVLRDPESVKGQRKLPKAGNDPLDFEDEAYTNSKHEAKERVMKDFRQAQ